ncbi:hypothetical protein [Enterococcus timonensis]|uniref:hypothetical protein n=1 Tax=Enterococcus timonensis TaxID=1852364 RepID=UPI0008DA7423|nr:hypothetical protein [Enterococcus timonensis]
MTFQLQKNSNTINLTIVENITTTKEELWDLISTTAGYKKWFPEIQANNLPDSQQLFFSANGIKEEMSLLLYDAPYAIKYSWAEATVAFKIAPVEKKLVQLTFQEIIPTTFPDLVKDLAGWTLQIQHLKQNCLKEDYTFDQEKFDTIAKSYQEILSN